MNRTAREKIIDFLLLVAVWGAVDIWIGHTPAKWAVLKAVCFAAAVIAAHDLLRPYMPKRKSGIITVGLDNAQHDNAGDGDA